MEQNLINKIEVVDHKEITKKTKIGIALRNARRKRKVSQTDIQRETGLSRTTLVAVEKGYNNPSWKTVRIYEKLLGIPLAVMLWESIEKEDVDEKHRVKFQYLKPTIDEHFNQILL